jgi:two-component system sensor histidine kinase/response regulator
VNQQLAVALLRRQGHTVVVAGDGRAALKAMERGTFDVLLADVQMPEMDGFELTAEVRAREAGTGRRLPIVALTAHALKGDRERCLEAGMDEYVSKPIEPAALGQALARFFPDVATTAPAEASSATEPGGDVFDLRACLGRVSGNRPLLREVIELFRENCTALLAEMDEALKHGDADRLRRAAHTLKGSAGIFAAERAVEAARALEAVGRDGDLTRGREVFARVSAETDRLRTALAAFEQES